MFRGERSFVKKFKNEQLAQDEFVRSQEIYGAIQRCKFVRTPAPFRVEGRKVFFELVRNAVSLKSLTNRFFVSHNLAGHYYRAGKALAEFHAALNPGKKLETDVITTHGDFWIENVLVSRSGENVYFVDFSRPKLGDAFPQGDIYQDIGNFLTDVLYRYPLYVFFLRYRKINQELVESFLRGYVEVAGVRIDDVKLSHAVLSGLDFRKKVFSKKNVLQKFFWTRVIEGDMREELKKIRRDYRSVHDGVVMAEKYDEVVYGTSSPDVIIWEREKRILRELLTGRKVERYLDFACGTGRVLAELEKYAGRSFGVDVSGKMPEKAKAKNTKARLIQGDPTQDPDIIEGTFDLITAFRFFLNAQQELRDEALRFIHSRLTDDGLFIFNNHGNKRSMRKLVRVKKLFERDFRNSELGHDEIVDMLEKNSFVLKSIFPVNYFLRFLLKLFPLSWTDFLNDCLSSRKKLEDKAVEVIYVCRKK